MLSLQAIDMAFIGSLENWNNETQEISIKKIAGYFRGSFGKENGVSLGFREFIRMIKKSNL